MKKIFSKKVIAFLLSAISVTLLLFTASGCNSGTPTLVLDNNGNVLGHITSLKKGEAKYEKEGYSAYVDLTLDEAIKVLMDLYNLNEKNAGKKLLSGGYTIETVFDPQCFSAIEKAYNQNENVNTKNFGASITNLEGKLLAVYGNGKSSDGGSTANMKLPPYSSLKPLSVYTPLIDKNMATWSSVYLDSPVKKITDEKGEKTDWPTNSTNTYTKENISIANAVKKSVNTVAVRALKDLEVERSLNFLKNSFDMDLKEEETLFKEKGDEEILGNLAMGYLRQGLSTVDMAGYFQIFANGGEYTKPYTIAKILDKSGKAIYTAQPKAKRVIKSSTAEVMNKMLVDVTSPLGTGYGANVKGIPVGGKTGTGTTNNVRGNWFVGFTPEITCSVWHGEAEGGNIADVIFASIVSKLNLTKTEYPSSGEVTMRYYCPKSGLLFGKNCTLREKGYFIAGNIPQICEKCER